jgi:transposase
MAGGRPKEPLILMDAEREQLERWARRPKSSRRLAQRSRIVLACAEGEDNSVVAETLAVSKVTVGKWRKRFLDKRLDGLVDEPRPGTPRTITDADVERVVTKTLETKPKNATHWSTRSMAEATGMSQTAIVRIWHASGLQPHRTKTFKLSEDPLFIEKVRDVVGLYMNPPEHAIVLSIDEKSQLQALDRTQPAAADGTLAGGAAHARLRALRDHVVVRRLELQNRRSHRALPSASSTSGVPELPQTRPPND